MVLGNGLRLIDFLFIFNWLWMKMGVRLVVTWPPLLTRYVHWD
jgi:hypothetical protein